MPMKTGAATDATDHTYIDVTRAHTRGYTAHRGEPVASVATGLDYDDAVDGWVASRCSVGPNLLAGTAALFEDWSRWALEHECFVGSIKRFAVALNQRGFARHNTGQRRGYRGLALKPPAPDGEDQVAVKGPEARPDPIPHSSVLALDLGTTTGWAIRAHDGLITSGTVSFRPQRFDGGGMRYLRFTDWVTEIDRLSGPISVIWFEEVRRHAGTDAAHVYGGLMATLTAWAELRGVPYEGVPVGTIKRHATGKGNAPKEAMIAAARSRGFSPADDNEADAIAILLWALETRGGVQ